jgi:hypothetical protein
MNLEDKLNQQIDFTACLAEFKRLLPAEYFDSFVTRNIKLDGVPEKWNILKLDDSVIVPQNIFNLKWANENVILTETPPIATVSVDANLQEDYTKYKATKSGKYIMVYFPEEVDTVNLKAYCALKSEISEQIKDSLVSLLFMYINRDQSGFFSSMKNLDVAIKNFKASERNYPKVTQLTDRKLNPFQL